MKNGTILEFKPRRYSYRPLSYAIAGGLIVGALIGFYPLIQVNEFSLIKKPYAPSTTVKEYDLQGVARVIDGDTLSVAGTVVRFHGIDAPELAQQCERAGKKYRCGQDAKEKLNDLIGFFGSAYCDIFSIDKYGRSIGRCYNSDGIDLQAQLVRDGNAIAYTYYSSDYISQQQIAKTQNKGIWAGSFQDPYHFRRNN